MNGTNSNLDKQTRESIQGDPFYVCAINPEPDIKADPMHVLQLLDDEADTYSEPGKYGSRDEECQLLDSTSSPEVKNLPEIQGPPKVQAEFTEFLRRHIGLLQAEVSKKPALVLPMMLNVDEKRRTLPNIIKADTVHKVNKRTRKLIVKLISWCKW